MVSTRQSRQVVAGLPLDEEASAAIRGLWLPDGFLASNLYD
jgi:hypothetical protein